MEGRRRYGSRPTAALPASERQAFAADKGNTTNMTSNDWTRMRRGRWTTVGLIVVAAVVLLVVRLNQHQTISRAWSLYSVGYVLKVSQTQELQQTAQWLRLPAHVAGLPYGGAVVHPEGARGIAFVELLYGRMPDAFVDVSESQQPLSLGSAGRQAQIGGVKAAVGTIALRGVRRDFALFRHGGLYYLVVTPKGSPTLDSAVTQLAL